MGRGANITNLYTKARMKFMPFLDSFQSSFKIKCRFFARLYIVYRVAVSTCGFTPTIFSGLVAVEMIIYINSHYATSPQRALAQPS